MKKYSMLPKFILIVFLSGSCAVMTDNVLDTRYEVAYPKSKGYAPNRTQPSGQIGKIGGAYASGYENQIAVLVAVNDYAEWADLEGSVRDAQQVKSTLEEMGFGQIIELYDQDATRENILRVLGEDLRSMTTSEDLVVIYFAGHGQTETLPGGTQRGYIIPADARLSSAFTSAISMAQLKDISNRISAKHVLYVMDSCYSGLALTRGGIAVRPESPDYIDHATKRRAVQIITAGREGELYSRA